MSIKDRIISFMWTHSVWVHKVQTNSLKIRFSYMRLSLLFQYALEVRTFNQWVSSSSDQFKLTSIQISLSKATMPDAVNRMGCVMIREFGDSLSVQTRSCKVREELLQPDQAQREGEQQTWLWDEHIGCRCKLHCTCFKV